MEAVAPVSGRTVNKDSGRGKTMRHVQRRHRLNWGSFTAREMLTGQPVCFVLFPLMQLSVISARSDVSERLRSISHRLRAMSFTV